MNIVLIIIYIWSTTMFIWYGRHAKSSVIDRPLLLSSTVFNLLFEILSITWIGISIFMLFKNWRLPVFTFFGITLLRIFMVKVAEFLEDLALTPVSYLYKLLEDLAKRKLKNE